MSYKTDFYNGFLYFDKKSNPPSVPPYERKEVFDQHRYVIGVPS